ncbi:archaeal flagellin N-terminal-like domain-containing protein [Fusarium solani]|uniref:Archaeal flagellin N-terminal-like domain-containing protein n=1 Tax=Fusarium solani TaxID=169388 RepID=A0A9P9G2K6_FUSSL|nr:archaeal flagellin N-terminal-like domain-containing protein [Fusarium solani]KAH7231964.1 archaeal flagellin N-terminal-like domain-containing protein [Fusarium solani]
MPGVAKEAVVPIEAMLFGVSSVLVLARLFLRTIRQSQNLTVSDWLLVASLLDAAALFGTDTASYNLGGMDEYDPNEPERSTEDQITLMKVSFAGNYFYDTGIYFPKLALLALYFKLIPQTMPVLRKALYGVTALTGAFMVTTCFLDTFWCGPKVSLNWEIDSSCTTFDSKEVFRIDWGLNFVSDVLVFALPFPLLFGLQVSKRYLVGLVAIFASGLITVGASIARFATVEAIHAWTNVYVLSMTEMTAAIVVVSLPALKSLLHGLGLRSSKQGTTHTGSGYNKHSTTVTASSHFNKLSSGRDNEELYAATARVAAAPEEDSGSEVELTNLRGIYKSARISVTYERRSDISEWILLAVSYVFVGLRIYARLFRQRARLSWSEILLIISAFNALALIICDTLTFQIGVMDSWEPSVKLSKISFASNYFYDVGMGFPKMSMLAFYWAYFQPSTGISSVMRKSLYGITAFVCLSYTAILWDDTFFCGKDVSIQWSQEDGACSVFYAPEPFILNFTLNLACYIAVYALPLILLIQGVIKPSTGVTITFVFGTLTICTTIVRFVTLKVGTGQENLVYPLSMLEMALANIVVSLPGLKPLVNRSSKYEATNVVIETKN